MDIIAQYKPGSILQILNKPIITNKEELSNYTSKKLLELLDKKTKELNKIELWKSKRELALDFMERNIIELTSPTNIKSIMESTKKQIKNINKEIKSIKSDIKLDEKIIKELKKMITIIKEKYREIEPVDETWILVGGRTRKNKCKINKNNKKHKKYNKTRKLKKNTKS